MDKPLPFSGLDLYTLRFDADRPHLIYREFCARFTRAGIPIGGGTELADTVSVPAWAFMLWRVVHTVHHASVAGRPLVDSSMLAEAGRQTVALFTGAACRMLADLELRRAFWTVCRLTPTYDDAYRFVASLDDRRKP